MYSNVWGGEGRRNTSRAVASVVWNLCQMTHVVLSLCHEVEFLPFHFPPNAHSIGNPARLGRECESGPLTLSRSVCVFSGSPDMFLSGFGGGLMPLEVILRSFGVR